MRKLQFLMFLSNLPLSQNIFCVISAQPSGGCPIIWMTTQEHPLAVPPTRTQASRMPVRLPNFPDMYYIINEIIEGKKAFPNYMLHI